MIEDSMDTQPQGQIFSLFPTPLYTYKLENKEYTDVQDELQSVVDELYAEEHWGPNPNWNSSSPYLSNKGNFIEKFPDFIMETNRYNEEN